MATMLDTTATSGKSRSHVRDNNSNQRNSSCAAFAQDAYLSEFKPNMRDKNTWKRFHDKILVYGGSHLDQLQMLEGFLGREPNFQALVESLSL